jgi:hypothetical protein
MRYTIATLLLGQHAHWAAAAPAQPSDMGCCYCLQMARTQKNKATSGHLGMLKVSVISSFKASKCVAQLLKSIRSCNCLVSGCASSCAQLLIRHCMSGPINCSSPKATATCIAAAAGTTNAQM